VRQPGNEAVYRNFTKDQLVCDSAIAQALADQLVDGAEDAQLFPMATHDTPPFISAKMTSQVSAVFCGVLISATQWRCEGFAQTFVAATAGVATPTIRTAAFLMDDP
jgi:hypothetical protein